MSKRTALLLFLSLSLVLPASTSLAKDGKGRAQGPRAQDNSEIHSNSKHSDDRDFGTERAKEVGKGKKKGLYKDTSDVAGKGQKRGHDKDKKAQKASKVKEKVKDKEKDKEEDKTKD